jgi:hypothetical protein
LELEMSVVDTGTQECELIEVEDVMELDIKRSHLKDIVVTG